MHSGIFLSGIFLACLVMLAEACTAGSQATPENPEATSTTSPGDSPVAPEGDGVKPAPVERGKAVIHTTAGPITITFFPEIAPRTVAHLSTLMTAGCFQGVSIFRLEPDFVIQASPVSDPGCHPEAMSTVPVELSSVKHERSILSLARFEDPNSGTSSWLIVLGPAPSLDGQFTVFGRVVDGETTIRTIEAIGSTKGEDGMSRLNRPVTIETVQWLEPVE